MKAGEAKIEVQKALGIPAEKRAQNIGPMTREAFERLANTPNDAHWPLNVGAVHSVKASSFADPKDVAAFRRCKAQGKSDQECFKVGDNGIGCWGDDTTKNEPMCALPPDDMIEKFGSVAKAKHARVVVRVGAQSVMCKLADRMPWKKNIKNGAGIDLNPAACAALGLKPPIMVSATWQWA